MNQTNNTDLDPEAQADLHAALAFHAWSVMPDDLDRRQALSEPCGWPDTPPLALPPAAASPFTELLRRRRSRREFSGRPLPAAALAALLEAACAVTDREAGLRAVPSAGKLYPLELFVAAASVERLPHGLYRYRYGPESGLRRVGDAVPADFVTPCLGQTWVADASVLLLATAVLPRTISKYGRRGYRFVLFEAGHQAQNVSLMAAELGLCCFCVGGFDDDAVNALLGLDRHRQVALYGVAAGP